MTVSVAEAHREDVSLQVIATGTVMPWQELVIGARTTGLAVVEVTIQENDAVRAGDVLVRLDSRALKAQIAQQNAAVAEAQATLETAKADAVRGETLFLQNTLSVQAIETRRTAVRTGQAKLDQAHAYLDQLQTLIDHTVIRAPVDGVVSQCPVRLGTVPQAGAELARIVRDARLEIQAKVPERELVQIKPDQNAVVIGPDGQPMRGQVRDVAAKIDAATKLGVVYVTLPSNSGLRAGMFASSTIAVARGDALTIPEQALVWPNGRPSALVLVQDGTVRLVRLSTGRRQDGRIVVEAGLRDGDRVAVAGAGFLRDGDRVRVEPALTASDSRTSIR